MGNLRTTVILAEDLTEPDGFFTITEYSPISAKEHGSILRVHCPFGHDAVTPFAFVSTGLLSFSQAASIGSAVAFISAFSTSGMPSLIDASFSIAKKTGGAADNRFR